MTCKTPQFSTLPEEVAGYFLDRARKLTLSANQDLFALGSAPNAMFGVISGRIGVSIYSEAGKQFSATEFRANQWFGETPLLDKSARAFHAKALTDAEVAVISAEVFWDIVLKHPLAMQAITQLVAQRYRMAISWIEAAVLKPLSARLASVLLFHMDNAPNDDGKLPLSQDAFAAQLGVARQSVNKLLKLWEQDGVVRLSYATTQVLDRESLMHIASQYT
jgi:CRP/FNR family cyclic AMP-dependent transcriptional regulator